MILHMYCYFNSVGGFFSQPFTEKLDPDSYGKDYIQAIFNADDKILNTLIEDDLYYFGTFDNVSGELKVEKKFLLHCSEVVKDIFAKRKLEDNGTDKEDA